MHVSANDFAGAQAQQVIRDMGPVATAALDAWRDIALDGAQPTARRVGALRGLEAMRENGRSAGAFISGLLHDEHPAIRDSAQATLLAMRDPSALVKLVAECPPVDSFPERWEATQCLVEIARFGATAESYGPQILAHLRTGGGDDRAFAATTLGMIGYRPAAAELVSALGSNDWRIVLASARSLGWMMAKEADAALSDVARRHWLRPVRDAATRALRSIHDEEKSRPVYEWEQVFDKRDPFNFESAPFGEEDTGECASEAWSWSGGEIAGSRPGVSTDELQRMGRKFGLDNLNAYHRVANGTLLGTDAGEWGGNLWFQSDNGKREQLFELNIQDIDDSANGIIAIAGIAHMTINYGYVLAIKPVAGGGYAAQRSVVLPGAPAFMRPVGAGEFMIVTTHGAFVLHGDWRLEEAHCQPRK
jgi:hypothetical protein